MNFSLEKERVVYIIRGDDDLYLCGMARYSRDPDDALELTELEALRFVYRNRSSRFVRTRIERRVYRPYFEERSYSGFPESQP